MNASLVDNYYRQNTMSVFYFLQRQKDTRIKLNYNLLQKCVLLESKFKNKIRKQISFNFYSKKLIFRFNPSNLVLLIGEFLKTIRKVSSVISVQSFFEKESKSGLGLNKGSE